MPSKHLSNLSSLLNDAAGGFGDIDCHMNIITKSTHHTQESPGVTPSAHLLCITKGLPQHLIMSNE